MDKTLELFPENSILVLVDIQKGFTDEGSTFYNAFGKEEMKPISITLDNIAKFIEGLPSDLTKVYVRSEYLPGQFLTTGQLDHVFSYLCVKGKNDDCLWSDAISHFPKEVVFTKHDNDCTTEQEFIDYMEEQYNKGKTNLLFCGFTLSYCVQKTAISTKKNLPNAQVIAIKDLMGSRTSSLQKNSDNEKTKVSQIYDLFKENNVELLENSKLISWL